MPDDYPAIPGFVYIVDGAFRRCSLFEETTIGLWRQREGIVEIRRCDMFDHEGARLGDKAE